MPTKTTVAEFRDFYNDDAVWPNEAWYEDLAITIDGKSVEDVFDWGNLPPEILPSATMTISGGVIFRPKSKGAMDTDELCMETAFKRWRKAKTATTLVATIPNEKVEAFKAYVEEIGGRLG